MKSFDTYITENTDKLNLAFRNYSHFYAHTKGKEENETLLAHILLTVEYFRKLVESSDLEQVIDSIIMSIVKGSGFVNPEEASEFIKESFLKIITFHDYGKINENFQRERLGNTHFNDKVSNNISTRHSILSAYLFLADSFCGVYKTISEPADQNKLLVIALLMAHPVLKHHGRIDNASLLELSPEVIVSCRRYLGILEINEETKTLFENFLNSGAVLLERRDIINPDFNIYLLLKLASSLLTAADYNSTNAFMLNMGRNEFARIKSNLENKLVDGVYSVSYNKDLLNRYDYYLNSGFASLDKFSPENLNFLRQKLSAELIAGIRENPRKKLFYIEAPTGAGKTNLSLLALTELLKQKRSFTRIFYVFPFTTLITQTFETLKNSLGLSPDELAELHSKASFGGDTDDGEYGDKRKNYIDILFMNYPVCLMSHIKFFNILVSNEKEANYLLPFLANSVVIIDEVQAYNPGEWDKVNYLINKFSKVFNITFILMSATLPKISKLFIPDKGINEDNFTYLIKNSRDYYSNINFRERVIINTDYLETEFSLSWLADTIFMRSEEYFESKKSVNAIVEFVKKTSAHKFFDLLSNDGRFIKYEIFIITGTILDPRRREIIRHIKGNNGRKSRTLVITTQVIEAGVDIDMDIGFKDKSIIDSEEQFAGRINRNARKKGSVLYLFNSSDATTVYRSDLRYKASKNNPDLYADTLINKTFDKFYDEIFKIINERNNILLLAKNLAEFIEYINYTDFRSVSNSFRLIDSRTIAVFVPLPLPVSIFSHREIKFLMDSGIAGKEDEFIEGSRLWNGYESIILNKGNDFLGRIADIKIIQALMSRYTFNTYDNPYQINLLLHYGEMKYGYLYLENYAPVYSYETGLKADIETDCNFI